MALPANNTQWPPTAWATPLADMRRWEAWWTGDPQKLAKAYANNTETGFEDVIGTRANGKLVRRWFHGRKTNTNAPASSRHDLHVPIASDLCATSADLLYSQPPTIQTGHETTDQRISEYLTNSLADTLLEGAETGAALGGRYMRVTWDPTISDMPFLTTVDADHAIPVFRWGHLVAVTFWTTLETDSTTVWRHFEHHELDANGNGIVSHALYSGTATSVGVTRPLTEHPATVGLANSVDDHQQATEGITPGLLVAYIPNITPQRRWRHIPQARMLGRSDLDGQEPLMDALDEVYTSWMRDIRLGKARILADANMLEQTSDGQTVFNLDREVFTPLEGLAGTMRDTVPVQAQQFAIRVAEHQQTAVDLIHRIIRGARYSTSTFGDVQDSDITATEVKAREKTTMTTRDRKIRIETTALQQLVSKMLTIDQTVFNTPGLQPDGVKVTFPDMEDASPSDLANTAATMRSAQLLSLQTGVEMIHPDWDTTQVADEVQRLLDAQPLASPDQWQPGKVTDDGENEEEDTTNK